MKEHTFDINSNFIRTNNDFFPSINSGIFNQNISPIKQRSDFNHEKSQGFSKLIDKMKAGGSH